MCIGWWAGRVDAPRPSKPPSGLSSTQANRFIYLHPPTPPTPTHTDAFAASPHDGGRFLRALAPAAAAAAAADEAHSVADADAADAAHGDGAAGGGHGDGESHGSIFMQALSLDQRKVRKSEVYRAS